jgi:hypothetical protein
MTCPKESPVGSTTKSTPRCMKEHDPRCGGGDDEKLLRDVAEFGWHVVMVLDQPGIPGWAYSVGLYKTFGHPEILVFGLDHDLMHSMINSVGEDVRSGKAIAVDNEYPGLVEDYSCVFKSVKPVWYEPFLGFATWFYKGDDYPVLQCFWPDFDARYPWESGFASDLMWAQPLLFHDDPISARANELLASLDD